MPKRNVWFIAILSLTLVTATVYTGVEASRARDHTSAHPMLDASFTLPGSPADSKTPGPAAQSAAPATPPASTAGAAPSPSPSASATPAASATPTATPTPARAAGGTVVFLDTGDVLHPKVAVASLDDPDRARSLTALECHRVYFGGGRGICLGGKSDLIYNDAVRILDARLQPLSEFRESGLPSRARVSPDGRYATTTVFVSGDTYTAGFSSRASIIDTASGYISYNLETFTTLKDGNPFIRADFNFWGVTFTHDSNVFYATLGTGGTTYLVKGDLPSRTLRVIYESLECPALSPDGTRIAFKRRVDAEHWRLYVLDLATLQASPVSRETRSVDDQVEWLDGNHLLYGMIEYGGTKYRWDTWAVSVDASEAPRIFLHNALSPVVVRG